MTRQTIRSLAYLLISLPAGVLAAVWTAVSSALCAIAAVTALGEPMFLAVTAIHRRLATLERHRAGWVRGTPIASPYLPVTGATIRQRVRQISAQPATWRDLAWFVMLFPLGLAGGVVGIVVAGVTAGAVVAPAWAWAVPEPTAPHLVQLAMTTLPGRLLLSLAGLAGVPVAAWLIRKLAAGQARVANALLAPGEYGRLVQRTAQLTTSRANVVDVQAAELRRIERDLHDGAQARIVAAGMTLALAERKARVGTEVIDDVRIAQRQLDGALADLRRLVRGIHPPILTDRGLEEALSALAADAPLPLSLQVSSLQRCAPALESAAYFVVAEGIANAVKHASASSCTVVITQVNGIMSVEIIDDGRGGADPAGSGLDGLRRRVAALDGSLVVTSPPGGPTRIRAELPCAS